MTTAERPAPLDRLHAAFVVLLVALRPLCWDGAAGQPADLVWQALAVAALLIAAVERAAGLRPHWAWSWRSGLALGLLLALLPAALRSPEPAPAWTFWSGLAASLGAAAYLMQEMPARARLAWASLAAGLLATAVFGVMQHLVVLPAMAAAQQGGATVFDALPGDAGAVAERIARGGTFATFTLANQFGAYLALAIPIVAGMAWRSRGAARWTAAALAGLAAAALATTGAKGAWLALAAGAGCAWWLAWPGRWWRWLPLPLAAVGVAAVLSGGFAAGSVAVRAGYWRAAAALVAEAPLAGHGYAGFAAQQPRLMQPGDEPTRFVHNEPLEAAVAGGVPLALLLLAALAALAWPRRAAAPPPADARARPGAGAVWLLVALLPYLALLHAFDGNLGWWPGGGALPAVAGWALVLGAAAAACAALLLRAAPPPAWAVHAGLAAVALKSCIDFDLRAMGLVATALFAAVALAAPCRQAAGAAGRWLPLAGAALLAAAVAGGALTGLRLAAADELVAEARQLRDPAVARQLGLRLGLAPDAPPAAIAAHAGLRAWELAEGSPAQRLAALDLLPPSPETAGLAEALAAAAPDSAAAALRHAAALAAVRSWDAAADEAERAVALAPTAPRTLAGAAGILDRIVAAVPARAGLRARADALRAEAARLQPLVHPTLRLRD